MDGALTGEELVDHESKFLWEFEEGEGELAHRGVGGGIVVLHDFTAVGRELLL
jgi:hypothetical protein